MAGRAVLGILSGLAFVQEGHGDHTGGGQNNAEGCQNSKNRAQTDPGCREGGTQPLSVLHDVVSFMGGGRWTYSYSKWLTPVCTRKGRTAKQARPPFANDDRRTPPFQESAITRKTSSALSLPG